MQVGFLNFYGAVLDVAQQRETLVANNIANADTPGFKAQDVAFRCHDECRTGAVSVSVFGWRMRSRRLRRSIAWMPRSPWMATMSRLTMNVWKPLRMVSA